MRFKKTLAAVGAAAALAGGTAAAIPALAQTETPGATDDTTVEAPAYPGARSAGMLDSVASVLGMDTATLADQLRTGDTLTDIATAQDVPIEDVKAAIVNDATERLTAAVTDGRITQEHADEKLAELNDNLDAIVNGELPLGRRGGFGHHGPTGFGGATLDSVASVLGMDTATLADQLRTGDTLTDIATAQDVPIEDVKAAIVNDATERLTAAVTDGRITQEHADEKLAELNDNLDAIVNGELPLGRRGGFGHHGPTGFGGATLDSVASVLGMDTATLADQLRTGDTLTDIATAQDVPIEDVKAAIVNDATERLTATVTDGRITQEHADEKLAELNDNLDAIVNGELPLGRRGGFGHHGPTGFGGADDAAETANA